MSAGRSLVYFCSHTTGTVDEAEFRLFNVMEEEALSARVINRFLGELRFMQARTMIALGYDPMVQGKDGEGNDIVGYRLPCGKFDAKRIKEKMWANYNRLVSQCIGWGERASVSPNVAAGRRGCCSTR